MSTSHSLVSRFPSLVGCNPSNTNSCPLHTMLFSVHALSEVAYAKDVITRERFSRSTADQEAAGSSSPADAVRHCNRCFCQRSFFCRVLERRSIHRRKRHPSPASCHSPHHDRYHSAAKSSYFINRPACFDMHSSHNTSSCPMPRELPPIPQMHAASHSSLQRTHPTKLEPNTRPA